MIAPLEQSEHACLLVTLQKETRTYAVHFIDLRQWISLTEITKFHRSLQLLERCPAIVETCRGTWKASTECPTSLQNLTCMCLCHSFLHEKGFQSSASFKSKTKTNGRSEIITMRKQSWNSVGTKDILRKLTTPCMYIWESQPLFSRRKKE